MRGGNGNEKVGGGVSRKTKRKYLETTALEPSVHSHLDNRANHVFKATIQATNSSAPSPKSLMGQGVSTSAARTKAESPH